MKKLIVILATVLISACFPEPDLGNSTDNTDRPIYDLDSYDALTVTTGNMSGYWVTTSNNTEFRLMKLVDDGVNKTLYQCFYNWDITAAEYTIQDENNFSHYDADKDITTAYKRIALSDANFGNITYTGLDGNSTPVTLNRQIDCLHHWVYIDEESIEWPELVVGNGISGDNDSLLINIYKNTNGSETILGTFGDNVWTVGNSSEEFWRSDNWVDSDPEPQDAQLNFITETYNQYTITYRGKIGTADEYSGEINFSF